MHFCCKKISFELLPAIGTRPTNIFIRCWSVRDHERLMSSKDVCSGINLDWRGMVTSHKCFSVLQPLKYTKGKPVVAELHYTRGENGCQRRRVLLRPYGGEINHRLWGRGCACGLYSIRRKLIGLGIILQGPSITQCIWL